MPFHNYAGPGTNVEKQVYSNKRPTTFIDKAALAHDIEYLSTNNETLADIHMIENLIKHDPIKGTIASIPVGLAFLVKDLAHIKLSDKSKRTAKQKELKEYVVRKNYLEDNYFKF